MLRAFIPIFLLGCVLRCDAQQGGPAPIKINLSERLTIKDVFEKGFRPSEWNPYGKRSLRDWEPKDLLIVLSGVELPQSAEYVTFDVYDNGDIGRLDIIGNRKKPMPIDEVLDSASKLFTAFGENSDEVIKKWKEEFKNKGRITFIGQATKVDHGRRMSVEILPSGFPKDHAALSVTFEWDYQGNGPNGGKSEGPVAVPAGFDWDVSFEAWQRRSRERAEKKMAEQAGTVQPATRPESKSEGGDKPQPESEGCPR